MPRIPEAVLESVIYLYPTVADAEKGKRAGGTGFLVGVADDPREGARQWGTPSWNELQYLRHLGPHFLYAVTAAHVIVQGDSPVVRLTIRDGATDTIDLPLDAWRRHPNGDDVAICPIGFSGQYEGTSFIPESFLLTAEARERASLGPGDEAFFVGRFVGHDGLQRNRPTVRFGNIAMMPEKIYHPGSGLHQESFLVEMRSLPGYSGSPVFIYDSRIDLKEPRGRIYRSHEWYDKNPWRRRPTVAEQVEAEYAPLSHGWLLGIDWAHLPVEASLLDRDDNEVGDGWHVNQNSGMMAVVPAWKLHELLHDEEIEAMRKDAKRKADEKTTKVALDTAAESYSREDFLADLRKSTRRRKAQEKP